LTITFNDIDFLIVGAAKCATTWLQRALQQDIKVMMPDPELHYFSRELHKGESWYLSQFETATRDQVVGEKSNSYLDTSGTATLIHNVMPHVKIIAQLRSPVDRAYSDYCMLYRRGEVDGKIDTHLNPDIAHGGRFLQGGLYARQLEEFRALFPEKQMLIMFYENMKTDYKRQISKVRTFLALDPLCGTDVSVKKVKDKRETMLSPEIRRNLAWLKPVVAPLRQTETFRFVWNKLATETEYPPLTELLRVKMEQYYVVENQKLRAMTGNLPPNWK
jgi:hypothetical protein